VVFVVFVVVMERFGRSGDTVCECVGTEFESDGI